MGDPLALAEGVGEVVGVGVGLVVGVSEGLAPMERDGVGDGDLQSGPLIGPLMPLLAENTVT